MTTSERRFPWVLPAAAAAGVAAIVAGVLVLSPDRAGPGAAPVPSEASRNPDDSPLLVRNGDRVEVAGTVVAAPGKPVVWCPDIPKAMTMPGGRGEIVPSCADRYAVTVTGVDLDRLSQPRTVKGVRAGEATLRGSWQDRTIAVDEQLPRPQQLSTPTPTPPDRVPCTEPAGGWKRGKWGDLGLRGQRMFAYVGSHPERFGRSTTMHPDDVLYPTIPPDDLTEVYVVEVLDGNLEQARRDLAARYDGNICVIAGDPASRLMPDGVARANAVLQELIEDETSGVWGFGRVEQHQPGQIDLVVLDESVHVKLKAVGLEHFEPAPGVRPIS